MPTSKTNTTSITPRDTSRFSDIPPDLIDRLTIEVDRRSVIRRDAPMANRFVQQLFVARRAEVLAA
ncbi:hypothetical protein QTO30_00385 [Yoonia sp. GPGPB17]|uniref:hypothetical protein n=1 Tax=Yoonia sp. GPGPB17 TaxID=3026147 RepID=UPI0030BFB088